MGYHGKLFIMKLTLIKKTPEREKNILNQGWVGDI